MDKLGELKDGIFIVPKNGIKVYNISNKSSLEELNKFLTKLEED